MISFSDTSIRDFHNKKIKGLELQIIKEVYKLTQYPTREQKEKLSRELNLEYNKVDKWFSNRRALDLKKSLIDFSKKSNGSTKNMG